MNDADLLDAIAQLKGLLVSVATGGPRIDSVNVRYQALWHDTDSELTAHSIRNPNQLRSLWDWHGRWSSGDLPRYADRRAYVRDLYSAVEDVLNVKVNGSEPSEPTGWERVDRQLESMRRRLADARSEEDYQGIGLLGREVLISLAQAVYEPDVHTSDDGITPSESDAKRMLTAFVGYELGGGSNEELRRAVRGVVDSALALQHDRNAELRGASLTYAMTAAMVDVASRIQRTRLPARI